MVQEITVKSILNKHKRRDEWFLDDYSVNPYSGCSFNCLYCYSRGSKYGKNRTKGILAKTNAPELLERQLSRRASRAEYGIIAISTSTEPYMPVEEKLQLTKKVLQVCLRYRFPVHILTKSTLVERDLELLKEIDRKAILPDDLKTKLSHGVLISFSFSTLDEQLARRLEPGAPGPVERLKTLKRCKQQGLKAGVCYIPVLPFISDTEQDLQRMINTAASYGADYCLVGALTLFGKGTEGSKYLYYRFLERHYPTLVPKYRKLYRVFSSPQKQYQKRLEDSANTLCQRYGIDYRIV